MIKIELEFLNKIGYKVLTCQNPCENKNFNNCMTCIHSVTLIHYIPSVIYCLLFAHYAWLFSEVFSIEDVFNIDGKSKIEILEPILHYLKDIELTEKEQFEKEIKFCNDIFKVIGVK